MADAGKSILETKVREWLNDDDQQLKEKLWKKDTLFELKLILTPQAMRHAFGYFRRQYLVGLLETFGEHLPLPTRLQ